MVRRIVLFLLALCILSTLGCNGTHLAGTHDVELDYEILSKATTATGGARHAIEARLGAARVAADVEPIDAKHMRVTVDADELQTVDDVLTWRGGLALYEEDPAYAFAPKDPTGLTPKTEPSKTGAVERYFTGSRERVVQAIDVSEVDEHHRVILEALDPDTVRTHVVKATPALDLRDVVDFDHDVAAEKKDLVLYVKNEARLTERLAALGNAPTLVVLGRSVVTKGPLADRLEHARGTPARAALVLPMGNTIYAFARAHSMKLLLSSGSLPTMTRTHAREVPPSWPIAFACIVVPMILSGAWLFFVRRFDRAFPEPWWLVLATFGLGGLGVVLAGALEYACMASSPYLNPSLMTLGGQLSAFPIALAAFTIVVGVSEEGAKLLGAWSLAAHRREFDEPVDGIVYGAASALGFAAVENIKYFAFGRLSTAIILARTFTSIPAHMFFGAIWGYALGKKLVSKKTSVLLFLAWAALMHGAFDTFLSIDGLGLLAMVLLLTLGAIFIVLLRRALRHGAIGPNEGEAPPSMTRMFFAVGRPGFFALSVIGLLVFAALLFAYGVGHQVTHQKVTYPFLAISSSLVALVGLSAYGIAATMPLDVAIDDNGVTFAGRAVPWSTIRGAAFVPLGTHTLVRLDTTEGPMMLGPGREERMRNLERVIGAKMSRIVSGGDPSRGSG